MQLHVSIDKAAFRLEMLVFHDRVTRATSNAVNAVTQHAQTAVREHTAKVFTLRRPAFARQAVKLRPFSTPQTLTATLAIDPPGGAKRDVFTRHELGGVKKPLTGTKLAIPLDLVQPDDTKVVPKAKRPRNLRHAFKGQPHRDGSQFLLQRVGRGKNARVEPAYLLIPQVRLKPRLAFQTTVTNAVREHWTPTFNHAWKVQVSRALSK